MTSEGEALARMREICLALPDTKETLTWGQPHFRVLDKIFAGCGSEGGTVGIGFKLTLPHQAQIVKRPGFSIAPYVGKHGWVSVDAATIEDWDEIAELVRISYGLIAPKKSLAKLGERARSAGRAKASPKRGTAKPAKTKKAGRRTKA